MNKLVLIGNGFDLAHNLKTKYKDFILWYLNSSLQILIDKFKVSDNLLSANIKFRVNNPPTQFKTIEEFNRFLSLYGIEFKYNYRFFEQLIRKTDEQKWVDIESEYYSALLALYKTLEKGNIERHERIDNEVKKLNQCFDAIKVRLIEYLITVEDSTFDINPYIANNFIEEFGNQNTKNTGIIMFLNFNYTSTIENYLNIISLNSNSVNYIHGKLNDPKNPIIFGYGDEMDSYYSKIERLNSNEFLRNFKSFEYFKTKNYQKLSSFLDSDRFQVYIMGHSCGISDRVMLNNIFEHKNCTQIKIYYHKINETDNDYFEKTQEISRQFKPESKSRMRRIIVPFTDSVPLVDN